MSFAIHVNIEMMVIVNYFNGIRELFNFLEDVRRNIQNCFLFAHRAVGISLKQTIFSPLDYAFGIISESSFSINDMLYFSGILKASVYLPTISSVSI